MSASFYPDAIRDLIADRDRASARVQLLTLHTAVTDSSDIYGPARGRGRTYAHFYNPREGKLRQHQEIGRKARADGQGNDYCVSVEHWDGYPNGAQGYWKHSSDVPPFTDSQMDNDAGLFAFLVARHGLQNRIATPDRLTGLGWHRLGCRGNFGRFDPKNRLTWDATATGVVFSPDYGKVCPGDRRIGQVDEIYDRAQFTLAEQHGIKSARYNRLVTIPQQIGKIMSYMILHRAVTRSNGKEVQMYALVAPGFFLEFTGVWTANKLAEIHGVKEILTCTEQFWNASKSAANA